MLTVELNNGLRIPQVGYGVFQVAQDETQRCVEAAIAAGYRHIDTASAYNNEAGVGAAIRACGVARDELWVTTKLRNADQGAQRVRPAFEASLEALGLDRVDLYLLHWPMPMKGLWAESYRVLEELQAEGLARAIGVCNFMPHHLDALLSTCDVVPAVNQIELHPAFQQADAVAATRAAGVAVEAYSPLGRARYLEHSVVAGIARSHGVSPAQVVLRWHLQHKVIVIPKTVDPARMAANIDLFGFSLSGDEMAALDALESGGRTGQDPDTFDLPQTGPPVTK